MAQASSQMTSNAQAARPAVSHRALVVAPSGDQLIERHSALFGDLVGRRHRILCLAPRLAASEAAHLASLGAETRPWPTRTSFLRALAEHHEASALRALIADWQPHVALVAVDDETLPALASARDARVPRVLALVDGLPQTVVGGRQVAKSWRRAFNGIGGIVCCSDDDQRMLAATGFSGTSASPPTAFTGSGVDLTHHAEQRLPGLADGLVFAMMAPLDREHGLEDYLNAAAAVAGQAPNARFLLAGPLPADGGATAQAIASRAGTVEHLGSIADVRTVLARSHVFVYPTRSHGVPRPILEALAAGRPVITTDAPGSRETVDVRVNGCLVPPGDAKALADAMASFLRRPDLIASMARAARLKAERRFDEQVATARLGELMGLR